MWSPGVTLGRILIEQQDQAREGNGEFTMLLSQIATAAKIISKHIPKLTTYFEILGRHPLEIDLRDHHQISRARTIYLPGWSGFQVHPQQQVSEARVVAEGVIPSPQPS